MSVHREITEYIVEQYLPGTPAGELPADYDLFDTGVIESLSLIQLITWIADRYAIPVDQIELTPDNFRTVAAIEEFIGTNRQTSAATAAGKE
jgi:methoxymalonate biosynthesis acyl carrier protein